MQKRDAGTRRPIAYSYGDLRQMGSGTVQSKGGAKIFPKNFLARALQRNRVNALISVKNSTIRNVLRTFRMSGNLVAAKKKEFGRTFHLQTGR